MEYLLKNVKLDKPEKHDSYVKTLKWNKFDNIKLPDSLPPLNVKPQVSSSDYLFFKNVGQQKKKKKLSTIGSLSNCRDRLQIR